jgi:hypothetical protein
MRQAISLISCTWTGRRDHGKQEQGGDKSPPKPARLKGSIQPNLDLAKGKPNDPVKQYMELAYDGPQLYTEQKRQLAERIVTKFGELVLGPYHFKPGKHLEVIMDADAKRWIELGYIVGAAKW